MVMKRFVSVLLCYAICMVMLSPAAGQKVQTIVPKNPVVLGTAFQVHYVISDPTDLTNTSSPAFDSFQVVSGPNHYKGNAMIDGRLQSIENITYTLVPNRLGTLTVKGITASFKNGPELKSSDAAVSILPQPKASFTSKSSFTDVSLYAPHEKSALQRIINENLFLKVDVDKRTCFEGEPVVATFTLYSRLQSSSEALKSPSFYGFSVLDMLNINEAHTAVETINGKVFNTSILRKVQLFPQQPGKLTIDGMYVQNEIEFDDSSSGTANKVSLEKELVSAPVIINVKPLPSSRPPSFTGAVGRFELQAKLKDPELQAGRQGKLLVTVKGKGNFIQFGAPIVHWPQSFESFDPIIKEVTNKLSIPVEGVKEYEFDFVSDSTGQYTLPPISFSYFDPSSDSFKTLTTDSVNINVASRKVVDSINYEKAKQHPVIIWLCALLVLLIIVVIFTIRLRSKKKMPDVMPSFPPDPKPSYSQRLSVLNIDKLTTQQTCSEVEKILVAFSNENNSNLSEAQKQELAALRNDCQMMMYAEMNEALAKEEIKARALKIVTPGP